MSKKTVTLITFKNDKYIKVLDLLDSFRKYPVDMSVKELREILIQLLIESSQGEE